MLEHGYPNGLCYVLKEIAGIQEVDRMEGLPKHFNRVTSDFY